MSPRPPRQRPGGASPLVPAVQSLTVGTPASTTGAALQVQLQAVASNPLNRRDVHADPDGLATFAESLREYGQLKACTVVTRAAFVAAFPELTEDVADAQFVQVDGARRRAAAQLAGLPTLDVTVNDDYSSSRARFIGATVAENLDRADLNPMEEADQIAVLVAEVGTQTAAAEQLRRTPAWVTQRLNLLKLIPDVQAALRAGQVTIGDVRTMHRDTPEKQAAALRRLLAAGVTTADRDHQEDDETGKADPLPMVRPSRFAAPYLRLADDRPKIAAKLRAELPSVADRHAVAGELRALADDLERDHDRGA